MQRKFHPVADIFPLMVGEEFDALVESIRTKGLLNPIWLHPDGSILDGRNRYRGCLEAGVEPWYQTWNGKDSLADFVVAQNIDRRHLNGTQRALLAKRLEPLYAAEAKERMESGKSADGLAGGRGKKKTLPKKLGKVSHEGEAADKAAKKAGTNRQYVSDLKKIEKEAPELYAKMEAGEIELPAAKRAAGRIEAERNLNSIEALEAKALAGIYDCIVIDPPWELDKIERDTTPEQVSYNYPVMDVATITGEVGAHLAEHLAANAHVFLWTTQKYLPLAFGMIEQWELSYGETLVWHKNGGFQPFGAPQYNCEFVIHARRGSPVFLDTKNFPTCFNAPRTGHSEKPEEFYALLRRVTGGRRLDMYNRRNIEGFDGYGKEAGE
jgi:N6-adenosine-specific RNA methylase IME4